jgi:hypothetical protein
MPKLHFYISLRKDRIYVLKVFPSLLRVFKKKSFIKLLREYYPSFKSNELTEFVRFWKENNHTVQEKLKKGCEEIVREWRKKEKDFFKKTEEKFGKWKRKKYFCHLSSTYVCGGGYKYPTVIVFPFSTHVDPIESIQHELLHLHLIEDVERLKLKPKNYFKFSEIAVAFASTQIGIKVNFPNDDMKKYFGKIKTMKADTWENFICFLSRKI